MDALRSVRVQQEFVIELLKPFQNRAVRDLIYTVMPEFGCDGPGFAMHDAEVSSMYESYSGVRSAYFVLKKGTKVVGGAGIAPLQGGPKDICELRKMYFLPEARGAGMGMQLLKRCLQEAKNFKYRQCYLETTNGMLQAQRLYDRAGFKKLKAPLGQTGHHSCDRWYLKSLDGV